MNKLLLCSLLLLAIAVSCKKDKLEGEKTIFVGTWELYRYDIIRYYPSINSTTEEPVNVLTDKYQMIFEKKGKVCFKKNGEQVEKFRIIVNKFENDVLCFQDGGKYYRIYLDDKEENTLSGCITDTTLTSKNVTFPFQNTSDGGAQLSYRCYWKKLG